MSGIAGIIHFDGKPVEPGLIEKMTSAMAHRGPDGINHWVKGSVALGQCMLRVLDELKNEVQPCTLDGQVWIVADSRIDGQMELLRIFQAAGYYVKSNATDAELILHAYSVFGDAFLEHIIGDFAFALWDSRSATLICARDHFGVRPFFYAKTDRIFLFASDIDAILKHPIIAADLDENAIGDFLLFGDFQSPDLSVYRNIRRLPAATCIRLQQDRFYLQQYWILPLHNTIRYRKDSEYVDRFQEVFGEAVNDRLRANLVAIELSGGMDSSSIAAITKSAGCLIAAHTGTCHDLLSDDQEGYYADMVASYLNIPIFYQACDSYALFDRFDDPQLNTSEPYSSPDKAVHYDRLHQIINNGTRVLMTGQGGDALFMEPSTYYVQLLLSGRIVRLLTDVYRRVRSTGSLRGMGLRSALMRWRGQEPLHPVFPDWVDAEFAKRTQLKERWELNWRAIHRADTGGTYFQLCAPWISSVFEGYEKLKMPLVARHPFFDVRLVMFMLSVPNHIKLGKWVMRDAMRGRLPEPVRKRPKGGSTGDLVRTKLAEGQVRISLESGLSRVGNVYIDAARYGEFFQSYVGGEGAQSVWSSYHMISPIALNNWLIQHTL